MGIKALRDTNIILVKPLPPQPHGDVRERSIARAALLPMLGYCVRVAFTDRHRESIATAKTFLQPHTILPALELKADEEADALREILVADNVGGSPFGAWTRALSWRLPASPMILKRYVEGAIYAMNQYVSARHPPLGERDTVVVVLEHGPLLLTLANRLLDHSWKDIGVEAVTQGAVDLRAGMALIRPYGFWGGWIDLAQP